MSQLDWMVVGVYMTLTVALGLWLSRRASRSMEDFFVGGRAIPWWLAGASMAATTFNVDTPLYVSGVVIGRGIAGNWEWWAFVAAHVSMIYLLSRLWRRAGVLTDMELIELRYGGQPAAWLRGVRAFVFAVPINAIVISYGMLAMRKLVDALGLWEQFGLVGEEQRLWTVVVISAIVLLYAAFAGLWGVVTTDFFQLILALVGALIIAAYALAEIGGLAALPGLLDAAGHAERTRFVPTWDSVLLPIPTFFAYIAIQWWAFRNADGGGVFVQRLASVRNERDAERAAWTFNVIHYVLRAWPWILVALIALLVLPDLQDPEIAYPTLMRRYLPAGLLGLVFASLLAAFMSTVSSQVNWGASYLVNDIYRRFVVPAASERHLVIAGRLASVLITMVASYVAFHQQSITETFRFVIQLGVGMGAVLILRWFWWRVNAWAEITALLGGVLIAVIIELVPAFRALEFGVRQMVSAAIVTGLWVSVMFLTPPERPETLARFYERARPGGAWRRIREATGLTSRQNLPDDILRTAAGIAALLGANFVIGGLLLQRWTVAATSAAIAIAGLALLRRPRPESVS